MQSGPPHAALGYATTGLTKAEVASRTAAGQVNAAPPRSARSWGEIVRGNVLTWFNLILGVMFVLMVTFGHLRDSLFGFVLLANTAIGIAQEARAKVVLDRLRVLTAPRANVVRDGLEQEIAEGEVVLHDLVRVVAGGQVVADGEVLDSTGLEVDESLLTGESLPMAKEPGDPLLSGSFVVAGSGNFRTTAVGLDAYAQRIAGEGRRYTRMHSDIESGIDGILKVIGALILPTAALLVWGQVRADASFTVGLTNTVAAMAAMVPQGLVLLTSIAFAVSALFLARRKVLAQELPAVEGLARVDVLCVDKTGTITEPHPVFQRFQPVNGDSAGPGGPPPPADGEEPPVADVPPAGDVALAALGALAAGAASANATTRAIAAAVPDPGWTPDGTVPFSSARKWSALSFPDRGAWVLGAPDVLLDHVPDSDALRGQAVELARQGNRVLLLARGAGPLSPEPDLPRGLRPAGLIILGEQVRADAPDTLRYFARQGVTVKVISGDDPRTAGTIAGRAGVPGADRPVDARSLPTDASGPQAGAALASAVEESQVFGRVTPFQKRALVTALQARDHTVAMTGDGVNDVLALKQADLGIALGSGSDATKAVAQLILLDGRFSTLPLVVAEGRRVTANIERVANLFITKSVWAAVLAVTVAILAFPYPVLPRQLTLIDSLTIGIPAFFLALGGGERRYRPGFVPRVVRFAVPAGLLAGTAVLVGFLAAHALGGTLEQARMVSTIILGFVGLRVIHVIERPLVGWRLGLVAAMAVGLAIPLLLPWTREFLALEIPTAAQTGVTLAACAVVWVGLGLIRRWSRPSARAGTEP